MSFCLHCRFPLRDIAHKYKLARVLGRGGAGTVYLAHHIRLAQHNERVIKIITTPRRTEELEARFYQEVQITASLSQSNDHIVRIYDDFGYEKGLGYYYVMEYLQGQSLRELLDQQGALRPDVALPLFHQICMGIIAAHREGVIHRDLKPENVQIIRRPDIPLFAKVIDFGIAYTLTEDAAHITKGLIGTPQYMSPEQCLDKPIDQRTDIYAMGVVLYEMLTGATPFITDNTPPNQATSPSCSPTSGTNHNPCADAGRPSRSLTHSTTSYSRCSPKIPITATTPCKKSFTRSYR